VWRIEEKDQGVKTKMLMERADDAKKTRGI
jgi:hypothetical protein